MTWCRTVVEHMSEVSITGAAQYLNSSHEQIVIQVGSYVIRRERCPKLGQPVPESNFVSELNKSVPQQTQS